jgi:imidazolonepropionase-like amidohydrolase
MAAAVLLITAPAGAIGQDVAVMGGTVHTVSGEVLDGASVVIRDGRIEAVGIGIAIPDGMARIDATDRIVTPGLFEITGSLGLVEIGMVGSTVDASMNDDPVRAAFDVADAINPRSVLIPVNRAAGITTALTAPTGGLISGQAAVIDLVGDRLDDMLVRPRAAMIASYGAGAATPLGGSRAAVSLRLRELLDDARYWREHRAEFDAGRSRDLARSRLDLEALLPVLDGAMPLIVNVHRASDIEAVLRIAGEYGIHLAIRGAAEAWMVADRLAAVGVPVVVKPLTSRPSGFDRLGARFDNAAILHRAGVDVIIGSFSSHNARWVTLEAGNAVRHGLPWAAALEAVTLGPARLLDVADSHGSIEPGRVANLVVWSGDPFELGTRPETILIRGETVPAGSRQDLLMRRYRELDPDRPPATRDGGP